MKRRTEITIEVDRVTVINLNKTHTSLCESCGTQVSMAAVTEAAEMFKTTETVIDRLVEVGVIHVVTTSATPSFVCMNSLLALFEDQNKPSSEMRLIGEGNVLRK